MSCCIAIAQLSFSFSLQLKLSLFSLLCQPGPPLLATRSTAGPWSQILTSQTLVGKWTRSQSQWNCWNWWGRMQFPDCQFLSSEHTKHGIAGPDWWWPWIWWLYLESGHEVSVDVVVFVFQWNIVKSRILALHHHCRLASLREDSIQIIRCQHHWLEHLMSIYLMSCGANPISLMWFLISTNICLHNWSVSDLLTKVLSCSYRPGELS